MSNVPGGSIAEVARLGRFRFLAALGLATRQSSLVNLPSTPGVPFPFNLNFNENLQLRDLPALVTTVPGAQAIDVVLDHTQWVTQAANPVSYAPFIRKQPLAGHAPKPVIMQFAKGDNTVPNPTNMPSCAQVGWSTAPPTTAMIWPTRPIRPWANIRTFS